MMRRKKGFVTCMKCSGIGLAATWPVSINDDDDRDNDDRDFDDSDDDDDDNDWSAEHPPTSSS